MIQQNRTQEPNRNSCRSYANRPIALAEAQVRARAKASAEKGNYAISWQVWTYRLHGETVKRSALVATVRKIDGSGSYTITYRAQGVPHCSCPDAARHRGMAYRCKHVLMADAEKPTDANNTEAKEKQLKSLKTDLDREWLWPDGSPQEKTRLRNEITRLEQEPGQRSN